MRRFIRHRRPRGFTIIELLVVIGIIVLLVSLLVPAVQGARESGRRTQCTNNLKQLALALQEHADAFGYFPSSERISGRPRHGWTTQILGFLDQKPMQDKYDFTQNWYDAYNQPVTATRLTITACPSAPSQTTLINGTVVDRLDDRPDAAPSGANSEGIYGITDYAALTNVSANLVQAYNALATTTAATSSTLGNVSATEGTLPYTGGAPGILARNSKPTIAQVRDGLSNTILLAESAGRPVCWKRGSSGSSSGGQQPFNVGSFPSTTKVNGGGWSRNASDISLEGFDPTGWTRGGNGTTIVGINATNGDVYTGFTSSSGANNDPYYGTNGSGAPYAFHPGGANFAFGDGSVHFLSERTDIGVLIRLTTRDQDDIFNPKDAGL